MKRLLPSFSYIFHPLFISVYAVLIYFLFGESYFDYTQIYLIIIQIIIITIFIPVTFYYLLLSMGKVESIMLAKTAQRKIPLIIHAVLLYILIQKSITADACPELYFFFFGSLLSTLLALLLVFFGQKASLHMIGMFALTTFAVGISLRYETRMVAMIIVLLFATGLVASSRLEMHAHTEKELVLGVFTGMLPQIVLLAYWL